ncbi:MAG: TonB-dependent receptor plug domain-containing protein [Bacteroidales bacterium]|nr:TonB-dependent receptor plug domain-containing protein [Bacteroidales bacterium]
MRVSFLSCTAVAFLCAAAVSSAQNFKDTTRTEVLEASVVKSVTVSKDAPFAVANIDYKELGDFSRSGKEIPFLLSSTPGVLSWSENGVGTGTTYLRIRGAGDSRINVTIDGVPLNSPEDQSVFWANMNGYSHFLESIQIQRGVGTSTNGDGAFGGSVALRTRALSYDPSVQVDASYGSYNTYNTGLSLSSGLLWNRLVLDASFHTTGTDGYIHGTAGESGSWYGGLTWLGNGFILKYRNIGNYEQTGQAWNGVTAGNGDYSLMDGSYDDGSWSYTSKTGIKTYKDMYKAGLGEFNSLYESLVTGPDGLFVKDGNGKYSTERFTMRDGSFWSKTTDNFWQDHNILSLAINPAENWIINLAAHYTHGHGYYEEFRPDNKLKKFGLTDSDVKKTDFVRKKGLTQDTYGVVGSVSYENDKWDVVGGFSIQQFDGNHYGFLTYIKDQALSSRILASGPYRYYDSDAAKFDGSAYLKATYSFARNWEVFADAQYRRVRYMTDGINDKFYEEGGRWYNQPLDIDETYNFFNPKLGLSWVKDFNHLYASAAVSHREPQRDNFTDNYKYPFPVAERVFDYELGYNYNSYKLQAGANLYYMDYDNQLVQTGEVSEIGEPLTTNIKDSYRTGVELTAAWKVSRLLTLEGNAALSINKLKDFTEMASVDWDDSFRPIHYDDATLAFSPSCILNGFIRFRNKGFEAVWHTNFVSRQYLDNTQNIDRSLPAYSFSDLNLTYSMSIPKLLIKEAVFGVRVGNIFNAHYATSGWVYSSILEDYNHPDSNRYYQIGFIPMAGTTVMGTLSLRF